MKFDDINDNYIAINTKLYHLKRLLKNKLRPYVNIDDTESFITLVHKVNDIPTLTYDIIGNKKPSTNVPNIVSPNTDTQTNLTQYNYELYQRIRYYIQWLRYYLALKGVPIDDINNAHTLRDHIELIDFMDRIEDSILNIVNLNNNTLYLNTPNRIPYTYTTDTDVPEIYYSLHGTDDKDIIDGYIIIEQNNNIISRIRVTQPLILRPQQLGQQSYTIYFEGTKKYRQSQKQTFTINVLPPKLQIYINAVNTTTSSRYYQDNFIGYYDDTWDLSFTTKTINDTVIPNVPLTIDIDDGQHFEITTDNDGNYVLSNILIHKYSSDNNNKPIAITATSHITNENNFTNNTTSYDIDIYHTLVQLIPSTTYAGAPNYNFECAICDEATGVLYNTSYDTQDMTINFLGNNITSTINNGKAIISYDEPLDVNDYIIQCTLDIEDIHPPDAFNTNNISDEDDEGNEEEYDGEDAEMNFNDDTEYEENDTTTIQYIPVTYNLSLHVISNFSLPEQVLYYLMDTPSITCRLDGVIDATDVYTDTDSNSSTYHNSISSESSIVTLPEQYKQIGTHVLTLQTPSPYTETISYGYDIIKPFRITQLEYNRKSNARYKITFYDTEHLQPVWFERQFYTISNESMSISDDAIITSSTITSSVFTFTINILKHETTYGNNTLKVFLNGYEESVDFVLTDSIFRLLTSNVDLGEQDVLIQSFDENIDNITLSVPDSINLNEIQGPSSANEFRALCEFTRAGQYNITISDGNEEETHSITVNKGDLNFNASLPNEIIYTNYDNIGTFQGRVVPYYQNTSTSAAIHVILLQVLVNNQVISQSRFSIENDANNMQAQTLISSDANATYLQHNMYTIFYDNINQMLNNNCQLIIIIAENYNYHGQTITIPFTVIEQESNITISNQYSAYIDTHNQYDIVIEDTTQQ